MHYVKKKLLYYDNMMEGKALNNGDVDIEKPLIMVKE